MLSCNIHQKKMEKCKCSYKSPQTEILYPPKIPYTHKDIHSGKGFQDISMDQLVARIPMGQMPTE